MSLRGTPRTVRDLITLYRRCTPEQRPDDDRHAGWWMEQLGTQPLSALTTERIQRALRDLEAGGRSGSTVAFYLRFLRRVTAWGSCTASLPADPCLPIPLPKEGTPTMRVLTEKEEAQICQALGHPYNLWVRFAILTGLEQSEQFSLRWQCVDFHAGTLTLRKPSGHTEDLSLRPEAVMILRLLRQASPDSPWVFTHPKYPDERADPHSFYVSRWTRTITRLKLPPVAWKDLRHTCGVRLAQQGQPVTAIAEALRQHDTTQAYRYRRLKRGLSLDRLPLRTRVSVFADLTDQELHALVSRDLAKDPLTFGEGCRLYAVQHLKTRPSRVQFERIYRQHLQQWADHPLGSLGRKDVRLWYLGLNRTPSHANKALIFFRRVYTWAQHLELYDGPNPADGMRALRYRELPRERFLDKEEMQRFMYGLPSLPPKPHAILSILIFTGSRSGEARFMRWTDVDLQTRLWRKPQTKTGVSHTVPLPVQTVEALGRLPRTSEWVFPGLNGAPWSRAAVEKTWGQIRRRWGLDDVTLHDLRRTCASWLAIAGENLPTIQHVLNHRSLHPTAIYARLNTKAIDRALQTQADRLGQFMSPPALCVGSGNE